MRLNSPLLFWDHLARVVTFGLLGNIEDGRRAAAELLKLKPDFPARGRILIGRYIKFKMGLISDYELTRGLRGWVPSIHAGLIHRFRRLHRLQ